MHTKVQPTSPEEIEKLEDLGVEGQAKGDLKRVRCAGVNWIHLPQDREQCRALMNTVMNLRFS